MKDWSQTRVREVKEGDEERRDGDRNLESQTHCFGCGEMDTVIPETLPFRKHYDSRAF